MSDTDAVKNEEASETSCVCGEGCSCVAAPSNCVGNSPVRQASMVTAALVVGSLALAGGLIGAILGIESRSGSSLSEDQVRAVVSEELASHHSQMYNSSGNNLMMPPMEKPCDVNKDPNYVADPSLIAPAPEADSSMGGYVDPAGEVSSSDADMFMDTEMNDLAVEVQSFGDYIVREQLSTEEATNRILAEGYEARVIMDNGVWKEMTKDYSPTRLNLIVENGVVVDTRVG